MGTPWHESDEFWALRADAFFTPQALDNARREADWILRTAGINAGAVLDMPCGVGRHSLALAERGLKVTGVDRTETYLAAARSRTPPGASVTWHAGDMRTYDGGGRFDLALNLFTSLGYFETPQENQGVLENFRRALRPGGKLVIDTLGKEVLAKVFTPTQWQELPDGSLELREVRVIDAWRRAEGRWIVVTPQGKRIEHRVVHFLYDAAELERMLEAAGFVGVRFFGSLAGGEYGPSATRLVAVATAR